MRIETKRFFFVFSQTNFLTISSALDDVNGIIVYNLFDLAMAKDLAQSHGILARRTHFLLAFLLWSLL